MSRPPATHIVVFFARLNDGSPGLTSGPRGRAAGGSCSRETQNQTGRHGFTAAFSPPRACRVSRATATIYFGRTGATIFPPHITRKRNRPAQRGAVARRSSQEGTSCARACYWRPRLDLPRLLQLVRQT